MPNVTNNGREFIMLKSGKKRYIYRDFNRDKNQWCVVEASEATSTRRKKRHFYEIEMHGMAYAVTRPDTGLVREDGKRLGGFIATTAALKCWRVAAESRSTSQPYKRIVS